MDTSETYIKMCEKAVEIQKLSPLPDADMWLGEGICLDTKGDVYWRCQGQGFIWLPRQDQLQGMLNRPLHTLIGELVAFLKETWLHTWNIASRWPPTTWEQLLLAFVYKEKYNKTWNGEEWITS